MKDGAQEILGKSISGVVIKSSPDQPRSQLFLLFADGTCFEFYSDGSIRPTGGVDRVTIEDVRRYLKGRTEVVFEAYPKRGF